MKKLKYLSVLPCVHGVRRVWHFKEVLFFRFCLQFLSLRGVACHPAPILLLIPMRSAHAIRSPRAVSADDRDWEQGFQDDLLRGKAAYYSNLLPGKTASDAPTNLKQEIEAENRNRELKQEIEAGNKSRKLKQEIETGNKSRK